VLTPEIATSEFIAVEAGDNLFDAEMEPGEVWLFIPTIACYIKQGDENVVAAAASGSMLVGAGEVVHIDPGFEQGQRLSVIRAGGSDGSATLTRMRVHAFGE